MVRLLGCVCVGGGGGGERKRERERERMNDLLPLQVSAI